jgi:hypothetical protein
MCLSSDKIGDQALRAGILVLERPELAQLARRQLLLPVSDNYFCR